MLFLLSFMAGLIGLTTSFGQKITIPTLLLILIIIFIGIKKYKILNLCIACIGYMIDVLLNQIILFVLSKFFGIIVIGTDIEVLFDVSYTIVLILFFILMRQIFYQKMQINQLLQKYNKLYN